MRAAFASGLALLSWQSLCACWTRDASLSPCHLQPQVAQILLGLRGSETLSIAAASTRESALKTKDQNPETQLLPLREFVKARGLRVSGSTSIPRLRLNLRGRVRWRALLDQAAKRKIDVILVWKLDRAFRSVAHMATTVEQLRRWKVGLRSYSEPWLDTSGTIALADLMLNILASFAQFEKVLIAERVRAGMARAKKQGKRLGRRGGTWAADFDEKWSILEPALRSGEISHSEAARQLKVSRATVLRRLSVQCPGPGPGLVHAV